MTLSLATDTASGCSAAASRAEERAATSLHKAADRATASPTGPALAVVDVEVLDGIVPTATAAIIEKSIPLLPRADVERQSAAKPDGIAQSRADCLP